MFSYIQVNVYSFSMYILTVKTTFVKACFCAFKKVNIIFVNIKSSSVLYYESNLFVNPMTLFTALRYSTFNAVSEAVQSHQHAEKSAQEALQGPQGDALHHGIATRLQAFAGGL